MRVAFYTLGCKVNQYESEIMSSLFSAAGFDVVDAQDDADVYIINSCTVTAESDRKTRQLIRRFKTHNPAALVGLTGCFPQAFPDEAGVIEQVDVVQGSYNRAAIVDNVKRALATGERVVDISPHRQGERFEPMKADKMTDNSQNQRTRAFVKIEDGCDRYCSYCIIPKARGPVRSKPLNDIADEVAALVSNGYREIVLVGINLSSYGKECGLRLIDAVECCCAVDGVERVRLGSLEPELLTDDDMIRMAAQAKFCPQFHLSLQSGCDATLKRMNRHYTSDEYMSICDRIRAQFANPAITTDIMVGFAGETEAEFEDTLKFVERVGFARAHVFAYSRRKGTRADHMPQQVTQAVKTERSKRMISLTNRLTARFLDSQVGTKANVLIETQMQDGRYTGYTDNYTRVVLTATEDCRGMIVHMTLTGREEDYCIAQMEHDTKHRL